VKIRFSIILFLALLGISAAIDLNNLFDYEAQTTPGFITNDNTPTDNQIRNEIATLGRVLFYDKKMSLFDNVACASCHMQEFGFSDTARLSVGFDGGRTGRHSMRLSHARFGDERRFFWDKRASSLEDQSTQPIQDFIEMGFSGSNGQPDLDSLISKLSKLDYYNSLFTLAFGDSNITEDRMQKALAQFVRSIQSFDSKYDQGRVQVNDDQTDFPNYSTEENQGKDLFMSPPPLGGAGCAGCHNPPEFDIDPNSRNNGVIEDASNSALTDFTNTRSPTLRDLFNPAGDLNGPLMHNGNFSTMLDVINHYNSIFIDQQNPNLDNRLMGPGGLGQQLNLRQNEKDALIAFLKTLTSNELYTAEQWSDPFDAQGNLDWVDISTNVYHNTEEFVRIYPNPIRSSLTIESSSKGSNILIYDAFGKLIWQDQASEYRHEINSQSFPSGTLVIRIESGGNIKLIKALKI